MRCLCVVVIALMHGVALAAQPVQAAASADDTRELTVSGCLLRSGYAGYQLDEARLEAVEGQPVASEDASLATFPRKWTLEGGGNLGPRVGAKVVVVGRSDWQQNPTTSSPEEPPDKAPSLTVESVKIVAESCS